MVGRRGGYIILNRLRTSNPVTRSVVTPVLAFPPDHKDGEEKRSSKKAPSSDDKASELPKAESMEVDAPKAELNGAREDIQSEGDTQSN